MQITSLQLENFRNFEKLNLDFDPKKKLTVLLGDNAQGKTNLLESIYFLALTRSFRTKRFVDTIMWEREHSRISCKIRERNGDREHELEIGLACAPNKQKRLKKEGAVVESRKYLHHLSVVLFVPADIRIVIGEPELKRRYLNLMAVQAFPGYLETLVTYGRALKNRNETLKMIRDGNAVRDHLRIWDEKLADLGLDIWQRRAEIIDFFQKNFQKTYRNIANSKDKVELQYKTEIPASKQEYLDQLAANYDRDRYKFATHYGPHRDRFEILKEGNKLKEYGSRGECRTAVLALKLLELEFLTKQTGRKPVLLLDDVFSELDDIRQKHLMKTVLDHQTFLTTTHEEYLTNFDGDVDVVQVCGGAIKQ